ncbi:hypothetical protein ACL9RF_17100 [Sphingobacterium sp. Mn56C]|uniref:hypothetical protein n=1 Tax=Sphingobacterium sp. Mn56C TaxID=3395261 RepID=UPI003BE49F08
MEGLQQQQEVPNHYLHKLLVLIKETKAFKLKLKTDNGVVLPQHPKVNEFMLKLPKASRDIVKLKTYR